MTDVPVNNTPEILWAQRTNQVFLSLPYHDVKDFKFNVTNDGQVTLSAVAKSASGNEQKLEMDLQLFDKINVAESKHVVRARSIDIVLIKEKEEWWDRLLKESQKGKKWIKTDWNRWKDEDEDEGEGFDTSDMSGFGGGGMPGAGGMGGMDMASLMGGMGGGGGAGNADISKLLAQMGGGAGGMGGMGGMGDMMGGLGGDGADNEAADDGDADDDDEPPPLEDA